MEDDNDDVADNSRNAGHGSVYDNSSDGDNGRADNFNFLKLCFRYYHRNSANKCKFQLICTLYFPSKYLYVDVSFSHVYWQYSFFTEKEIKIEM